MDTQAYVSTRTHEHPHAHRHITRHMNTCLHTLVHTHACTQSYLYVHMNTPLCMWNTSMHTNVYHHTTGTHAITAIHAHTCNTHICTCNTDTPSHTCTHTMHACKTHPCTHAHTCTGMAGAGMHNALPRTSEEEEEEGRHIILFPPVQMTSLPWHQLCFDRFVIFLEHGDMGLRPSPQFHRWERRFLAMNLLEQNDITTEELGGPRRARYICSTPAPGACREAAQRRERHWTETSLCPAARTLLCWGHLVRWLPVPGPFSGDICRFGHNRWGHRGAFLGPHSWNSCHSAHAGSIPAGLPKCEHEPASPGSC